jgi:hypothetical protein
MRIKWTPNGRPKLPAHGGNEQVKIDGTVNEEMKSIEEEGDI